VRRGFGCGDLLDWRIPADLDRLGRAQLRKLFGCGDPSALSLAPDWRVRRMSIVGKARNLRCA
jgi:hypothetical protein